MNIMLVDSSAQALSQVAERLTSQQAALTLFLYTNARGALKFAIYHSIDIVYVRETLPDMTGTEITEHIRLFHPDVQCHILQDGEEFPFFRFWTSRRFVTAAAENSQPRRFDWPGLDAGEGSYQWKKRHERVTCNDGK